MANSKSGLSGAISRNPAVLEGDLSGKTNRLGGDIPGELVFYAPEKDLPRYDGSYSVTPLTEAQTLKTAEKYMEDDVKVKAIPVYEVSNTAGGTTVYIGTEV